MNLSAAAAFLLLFPIVAGAQSGRVKLPAEPSKTPAPRQLPQLIYVPTQVETTGKPSVASPRQGRGNDNGDDEVVKVDSSLVPIPVSVLDSGGRAVTALTLADFELQIDGKKADIADLAHSESPVRLAMLFDNSSSVLTAREFETDAAIKFFRRVIRPEKDLAALFSVSTASRLEQPLTADISALTRAIELFAAPTGATALLDGLAKSAEYLRENPGRRVVVIVSDGEDTYSDTTLEEAIQVLQTANVQVYVVKTTDFENYKRSGTRGGNANLQQLTAERRMSEIARQTGGAVYSPLDEREVDEAFRQISAEISQQYILSYYPENEPEKRGQFRTISVSVKGRPNLNVRTRKGYYETRR